MRRFISVCLVILLIAVVPLEVLAAEPCGIMPYTKSHSTVFGTLCAAFPGSMNFLLSGTVTYNLANDTVMYVEDLQVQPSGYALNVASWNVDSISYVKSGPSAVITVVISIHYSCQDAVTGLKQDYYDVWTETVTWTYN